jgi:hypothetical protein
VDNLLALKKAIEQLAIISPMFDLTMDRDLRTLATRLQGTPLPLDEMYRFCSAPVQSANNVVQRYLLEFAKMAAANKPVILNLPTEIEVSLRVSSWGVVGP